MGEAEHHAEYSSFDASLSKAEVLQQVIDSYESLVFEQQNWVCNLSNASSLIWHAYHSMNIPVNWSGFYLVDPKVSKQLILGPFQGKVACQTIGFGRGVCGTCYSTMETQLVPDVNEYPGHIACDGETQSEIVVPVISKGKNGEANVIRGVLDIDCLAKEGFDEVDKKFLELLAERIAETCEW
ncbi:hypothetical protein PACTADRAFT_49788 [Pachysolen tannophilus NRRL Y-2460]|uniref:GAF domain-containing protein n=1 Tax=Pachysolen tannophilus NRRL Y-2460 TaxID=669874 RepID=A0A1E4TXK0_PACTA|nr:hypothetical protein PACTADRAFT_49788 [Pachysolen tannophilus NRRL Y-2460]